MTGILGRSKTLINIKLCERVSCLPCVFVVFVQWQLGILNKTFFVYLHRIMCTHVKLLLFYYVNYFVVEM